MNQSGSQKSIIRFRTPDQLQDYLEGTGDIEFDFRAYPIAGAPEDFHYSGREKTVTRHHDRSSFDSIRDFTCYAFQCDIEGYSHTEYVDIEI